MGMFTSTDKFDGAAAITRSLLGYGVVSGFVYLAFGVVLGATRDGFEFARHPLSLLMLGDHGWLQRLNLVLSGAMVVAAALGVTRFAKAHPDLRWGSRCLFGYAACLIASACFAPDAMAGFPPGSPNGDGSLGGVLHMAFGACGFISVAIAALFAAHWHRKQGRQVDANRSRVAAAMMLGGFIGGAALSTSTTGIALLWVAVVAAWVWLAVFAVDLYKRVPHPLLARRKSSV